MIGCVWIKNKKIKKCKNIKESCFEIEDEKICKT
jgi:hypothetical protein